MEMFRVYSIGHSVYPNDFFLSQLRKNEIDCVVDVRSTPFSKYASQYNKDKIREYLKRNGLRYLFMGEELGARRSDLTLYNVDGFVDYEKVSRSYLFLTGIERIMAGLQRGYSIALMCTEKDPIVCHRAILVGKGLQDCGCVVSHIKEDGDTETQSQLEERMLNHYFPDWGQQSLFIDQENDYSRNDIVNKSYRLKNADIGYRLENGYREVGG
jgi:uncharacterized protein (DUF488 family)